MINADEHRPGKAAARAVADWVLLAARQQGHLACPEPCNDNVDDLAPFINLILAAGQRAV